jgi:hypothetical protein
MRMADFLSYVGIPAFKPTENLRRLLSDPYRVGYGALALAILGALYAITTYAGYQNGFGAVNQPFLNIPAKDYYLWETWFGTSVFFVVAIVFAGVSRLIALPLRGQGSFENTFAVYCISIVLPMFITMWLPESTLMILLPDLRSAPLGGFAFMPPWLDALRQIVGIVWPLVTTWTGIKHSEKLTGLPSVLVTVLAFIPTAILIFVFIR